LVIYVPELMVKIVLELKMLQFVTHVSESDGVMLRATVLNISVLIRIINLRVCYNIWKCKVYGLQR